MQYLFSKFFKTILIYHFRASSSFDLLRFYGKLTLFFKLEKCVLKKEKTADIMKRISRCSIERLLFLRLQIKRHGVV